MLYNLNKICYCLGRSFKIELQENYICFNYNDGKYTLPILDIKVAVRDDCYFYRVMDKKINHIKTKLESWLESK